MGGTRVSKPAATFGVDDHLHCSQIMTDKLPHHEADNDLSVVLNVLEGRIAHFGGDKHMAQMKTLCDLVLNCWTVDPKQRPTASDFSVSISLMVRPSLLSSFSSYSDASVS